MKHGRSPIPQPRRPAPARQQPGAAAHNPAARLAAGLALHQQGRLDQAAALYQEILQSQPQHFDALQLLAMTEAQKGNPAAALVLFEQALTINPHHAGVLSNYGNVLRALKRPAQALASYDQALKIQPDQVEAWSNRGDVLSELERPTEALEAYGRALAIQPDHAGALIGQGSMLGELKRHAQALESFDKALRIQPNSAEALSNRGLALYKLKRYAEALESCDRALSIKADLVQALSHRGNALRALQKPLEALESYDRALGINQDCVEALSDRGIALQSLNRVAEARDSYARALRLKPDHAETNWNEGLCRLVMGDFATGWQKYEWRWKRELGLATGRPFHQPLWLGREPLQGKTILLHAEQGLGDTIQFCRYAKEVAALGARVVLEVPPALKALLQDMEGVSLLLARGEPLPGFDYHCPLLSLPQVFRADLSNISGAAYLHSDPGKRQQWQKRLGPASKKRIGLVWSGAAGHQNDSNRSLSFQEIAPLMNGQAEYYCLQKELRPADQAALSGMPGVHFMGESLKDFSDTAAVVSLMDLVITVDTSVAHLAGALGKEVWVLLPFSPDWRWLLERSDSPWYSSARLFRQPALGDWASVLGQVRAALKARFAFPEDVANREAVPLHKQSGAAAKDPAAKLKAALALHQQGQLDQAAVLYQDILLSQPLHFEALQLLATIALQQKNPEAAVVLFDQALAINPRHASALNNRGNALRDLKRPAEALQSYEHALRIKPDYAEALSNRGAALRDLNRPAEALESCDRALATRPGFADALSNRAAALQDLRRLEAAPLQQQPDAAAQDLAAQLAAALALHKQGRLDQAAVLYQEILQSQPQHVEALQLLATVALQQKKPKVAVALFDQALAINPRHPSALNNRGNALRDLKRSAEALASYDAALRIKPDYVEALSGRGNALHDLKRYDEALASFDQALGIRPDYAEALNNRGNVLQSLKRVDEALNSFERALQVRPDYAEAHWNEGLCRLLMGDFTGGWAKYEWRWKREPGSSSLRNFSQPLWLGKDRLEGKTILLHAEQGLGDTIQFCRYARQVAALGARVVLEVQPPLKKLLKDLEGVSLVLGQGERLPDFDIHCPLMSLPLAFQADLAAITGSPYLRSDPEKLTEWQARLGNAHSRKVGLVWSGSAGHPHDHSRSLALEDIKALVTARTSYYCLQKEWRAAEPPAMVSASGIEVLGDALKDFSDTAAVVSLMDVVITVDTSVAHLAGALGKEVWILLPFSPDWRWLLERSDSPWYSSARLFRQPALGDWASVLGQVQAALAARFP
jgi:tetratricopeptide (TPR) repeat protein